MEKRVDKADEVLHDKQTPSHYVGIGASAGGLEALEIFFKEMPPRNNLAFIVIQHLSPDYKSMMVELLAKHTEMPIYRAEEGTFVEKDSVYLIPPKKNLTIFHGKLLLSDQDPSKGINLPIDIFFRSLAEDQADKAIGIILSGTGSDGTRGIRSIKENGGMVMVQDENSAKFDGMPRSAISTGITDYILPPGVIPSQLLSFIKHPYASKTEFAKSIFTNEDNLNRIFAALREKHKVDFTYYKPSTVVRRIERRMSVNQIHELEDYVKYLQSYGHEVSSLYRELLIGVTNFFRDPEVFKALKEKWLPELFQREGRREIRLWVAGCSTGEEAYTLAIICQECMEELGKNFDVKIFATDVDGDAIQQAGIGAYPESIAADVSPSQLSKYFSKQSDGHFYISRSIREMVVFAKHNIIKDPPFTNINLVSCRNLLIYLQPVLQKKVMEWFNFSLRSQGILLLGSSESTGDMIDYFESLDHKGKIFRSKGKRHQAAATMGLVSSFAPKSKKMFMPSERREHSLHMYEEEVLLDRILKTLSQNYFSCGFVVSEHLDLLHVLGKADAYLKFPSGKVNNDISKLVIKEISIPLATGIQRVFNINENVHYSNISLVLGKEKKTVNLKIGPLLGKRSQAPMAIVLIEELQSVENKQDPDWTSYDIDKESEQRIQDLEQELQSTRENLQATIEELETSNEELQATNEELLASNEELQSTNEELQSVNEELYTVNAEFQRKISELTELNNDIDNLLSSSHLATLFLDESLKVRKFTPQLSKIFKIIMNDIGRPYDHLTHNMTKINFKELVQQVHSTTKGLDQEVLLENGDWYLLRILPYFTDPRSYSGIVLTFIDITTRKSAEEKIRFQANLIKSVDQAIIATDLDGGILFWNQFAEKLYQWTEKEVIGKNILQITVPQATEDQAQEILSQLNQKKSWHGTFRVQRKDKTSFLVEVKDAPILNEDQELVGIVGITNEIESVQHS
ncbi:MAG: PAS domain-containing protein [SAR324 cluster bacterium]|nr:PAS domain-containing protein [SAR324 cluster bacterium]